MEETKRLPAAIRFGIFEVDLHAGELRRQGIKVKLQEQPFQLLVVLLERPGESVTRDELQKKLWPADTFVDFERGLNRAVNKLREALRDDAENPRFIQTLPRRGYRFVAPVEGIGSPGAETAAPSQLVLVAPAPPHEAEERGSRRLAWIRPIKPSVGVPDIPEDRDSRAAVRRQQILPLAVAGLAAIAAWGLWKQWRVPQIADRPFLQFELEVGPDEYSQPAISRDGLRIVFVSKGALAVRRLDQTETVRLAGTEGASLPFFSPNGRSVGFFAAGKLQKIGLDGGAPIALCRAKEGGGGTWVDEDNIIASLDSESLSRIPSGGAAPQLLTNARMNPSERQYFRPQALAGGKGILFASTNPSGQGSLRILTPNDGKVKTIVENSTLGRYAGGYLVYYQEATLFAAPMDIGRFELTGPAVPVLGRVSNGRRVDPSQFDLSESGTLIYREGTRGSSVTVSWLYPSGKTEPVSLKPGSYSAPRLSPDGGRLAVALTQEDEQKLWIYDFRRETWTRLTSDTVREMHPTWTPDGEFIAFRSGKTLAWTRSDGSGSVEHLSGVSENVGPSSFSPDGKWLTFWPLQPGSDLFIVPVERTPGSMRLGRPQPLLQSAASKGAPKISPDNRWVAYSSAESGYFEIYVRALSPEGKAVGGKWPVSNGGGISPMWSRHTGELFYQGLDRRIHVAPYAVSGDSFLPGKARIWCETRMGGAGLSTMFDVAPDGKRVLALLGPQDPKPETLIHVLLNVDSELRRRAPVRGR